MFWDDNKKHQFKPGSVARRRLSRAHICTVKLIVSYYASKMGPFRELHPDWGRK